MPTHEPPDGRLTAEEFGEMGTGYHDVVWDGKRYRILVLPGAFYRVLF